MTDTLLDNGQRAYPTSWSPDGQTLAYYVGPQQTATESRDLWMLHVEEGAPDPRAYVETPFMERGAVFSPDGGWVAYVSDKSGRNDAYARPFPGPGAEVTISVDGGQEPVWAPSGSEMYYRHDEDLLVVPLERAGSSLRVGTARVVFADPCMRDAGGAAGGGSNYDVSPAGDRFVMVEDPSRGETSVAARIHVVLNWFTELRERVPVD